MSGKCPDCGYEHQGVSQAANLLLKRQETLTVFLAMAVSKLSARMTNLSTWHHHGEKITGGFRGQYMAIAWDFIEANPFVEWDKCVDLIANCISNLSASCGESIITEGAQGKICEQFLSDILLEYAKQTTLQN